MKTDTTYSFTATISHFDPARNPITKHTEGKGAMYMLFDLSPRTSHARYTLPHAI